MAHFDVALAHFIGGFKGRGYFAAGENLDLEFVVGGLSHEF